MSMQEYIKEAETNSDNWYVHAVYEEKHYDPTSPELTHEFLPRDKKVWDWWAKGVPDGKWLVIERETILA